MNCAESLPYADPEAAARHLMEIASTIELFQAKVLRISLFQ